VYGIFFRPYYKANHGSYYSYAPEYSVFIATFGRGIFRSSSLVYREDEQETNDLAGTGSMLYPNPCKSKTTVEHDLLLSSHLRIEVYSIDGRLMDVPANGDFSAGKTRIEIKTEKYEPGIYFVRSWIENSSGSFSNTMKAVVLR